jgi:predicted ferric reductase
MQGMNDTVDDVARNGNDKAVRKTMKFKPYKGNTLDAPFFHIIMEPLLPILRPIMAMTFAIRWQLSRPLQTRVFPSLCPVIDFPVIRDLAFLTVGQVLLAVPLAIIVVGGYYFTFVAPDVENSGHYAAYAIYATFLTANKTNSVFAFLLGIPFERMIPYHNLASLITVVLSCLHGYVAYAYGEGGSGDGEDQDSGSGDRRLDSGDDSQYGLMGASPNLGKFMFDGENNTTGSLLTVTMMILVLSSIFPMFRRRFFDLWLWIHIFSAICVIIFATMHEVTSILIVAGWWLIDMLTRYLVMATCRYPHKAKLQLVSKDVVKISFEKPAGFSYNGGQFVQIAVQDLGLLAFHPISISSAPHEGEVTLHVRGLGNWSKKLVDLAKEKSEVSILLEGPYGSLSVDIDDGNRYKMVLLVSGGIGATHCSSVAKSIIHDSKIGRKLKHLRFVWAVRDLEMLDALDPLEIPTDFELGESTMEFRTETMHGNQPKKLEVVETDIFLTKAPPSTPVSLSDGRNIFFGRPDLDRMVIDMKTKALKHRVTHVAVFACGPKPLVDKLKDVCRKHSQAITEANGVTFDVHEEIFDF